jgi:hypothetical protein
MKSLLEHHYQYGSFTFPVLQLSPAIPAEEVVAVA